ncbi:hypothetical protein HU200_064002 [Digitaria exilis]|uniref:Pectinesterase inhibitor domain-containing protein n=1 Tax=Digitaria exilis TaxID=1010633 RepID=A0A835DVU7_9POAL|nr:hypothetical protein HU200_064002 [Digitaria exilis]
MVAVALSLSSTIIAGSDCPGAHINMTMEAACREATTAGKPLPMYKLCKRMLVQRTPAGSFHEASEYASIAAEEVWLLYSFVMYYMRSALVNSSIPGEANAAYELCIHDYQEADATMDRTRRKLDRVLKGLSECCGLNLSNEYRAALHSVGACRDRLAKLSNSPLLDNNEDIYNRTMVAYMLGKLIGIM